jgi:membrane associated rhomboid family serine protease
MFLHANLLHIAGNMLYLWIFGNNIEDVLGHIKFAIFYLLCGFGAAMGQVLVSPSSTVPMVGASGAIAGVLGAYLILFPRAKIVSLIFVLYFIQTAELPASLVLGFWIVLQVLNSLLMSARMGGGGGVAYAAHVGGFVVGVALIYLLGGKRLLGGRRPVEYRRAYRW